jgi:U3 small nucleolar ribonucleoprotein protein IMP4
LEAQERQTYERKQQLKDALASGKRLPTELKKGAKDLGRDLGFDDAQAGESERLKWMLQSITLKNGMVDPTTHIDNEYSRAGIQDPKIVITTSRDPSSKLLQFSKVCQDISEDGSRC